MTGYTSEDLDQMLDEIEQAEIEHMQSDLAIDTDDFPCNE